MFDSLGSSDTVLEPPFPVSEAHRTRTLAESTYNVVLDTTFSLNVRKRSFALLGKGGTQTLVVAELPSQTK